MRRLTSIFLAALPLLLTPGISVRADPIGAAPCGPEWARVSIPSPGTLENFLYGVDARTAEDVWAVGLQSSIGRWRTLTERWDGVRWRVVPSANGPGHNVLLAVAAVAEDDAWSVGYRRERVGATLRTLIEHWDGSRWSIVPSPTPPGTSELVAVSAASATDVWAVGDTFDAGPNRPLIVHWNGSSWSRVPSPTPPGVSSGLFGVVALGPNDAWAVGHSDSDPFVLHWNGAVWSRVPAHDPVGYDYLVGVTAVTPDEIWAVGYNGLSRTETLIERWDGTAWSRVDSPSPGDRENVLTGVAAAGNDGVLAVGISYGRDVPESALYLQWDGSSWSVAPGAAKPTPYAVDALPDGEAWAVGWRLTEDGNHTLAVHRCPA